MSGGGLRRKALHDAPQEDTLSPRALLEVSTDSA